MGMASARIDSRFDKFNPLFYENKGAILAQNYTLNTSGLNALLATKISSPIL